MSDSVKTKKVQTAVSPEFFALIQRAAVASAVDAPVTVADYVREAIEARLRLEGHLDSPKPSKVAKRGRKA